MILISELSYQLQLFCQMTENNDHNDHSAKNAELTDYPTSLNKLNKWTIPSVKPKTIYNIGIFDYRSRFAIKTVEQTLGMSENIQTIKLLSKKDLESYFKEYNFIHVGLIQIAFKPLTLLGMNASIMAYVRDGRCKDFKPSLAALVETSLCHGPVYFNVYPNLSLSLTDRNLLNAMQLTVHTNGYNFHTGSEIIAISYRIYFKVLNTLTPNVRQMSFPGTTTLVQTNLLTSNVANNKLIKWGDINFPEKWSLPQVTDPEPVLNQEIDQIIQTTDGDVEIKFTPQRTMRLSKTLSSRSYSSVPIAPHRASTSQIEEESDRYTATPLVQRTSVPKYRTAVETEVDSVETIRISQNQIPHGVYENPYVVGRTSPTPSDMSFNI